MRDMKIRALCASPIYKYSSYYTHTRTWKDTETWMVYEGGNYPFGFEPFTRNKRR